MEAILNGILWLNNNILWGIPMIALILGCGIFFTIRTKAFQIRKFGLSFDKTFGDSFRAMRKKDKAKDENNISPFEAFSTAVSGTIGTGSIIGVTTAIISGGPGAIFWMWVSAFFGTITKYSEITLSLYYRKKDAKGEFIGGPMYYIEQGTKKKWLAGIFAVCAMIASIGIGLVQTNTIQENWVALTDGWLQPWVIAVIVVIVAALVLIGGIKRIGAVSSIMVPFMAIFFIVITIITVICNASLVPAAFGAIFNCAFDGKAIAGGFVGAGIMSAMRYGFGRGIFCNEAGLGSSPIAHATAATKEPVEQGLWGIFEVFLVNFIICTLTALCVLTSGLGTGEVGKGVAGEIAMSSFSNILGFFGEIAYSVILPLFSFSTILAWAVYGSKATQYLFNKDQEKSNLVYNIIYLLAILIVSVVLSLVGSDIASSMVWQLSDMFNATMAIPNLIALVMLSGTVLKITKNYFDRKKGLDIKPMVSAYTDLEDKK